MSKNALYLLNDILAQRDSIAPDWTASEYFELFSAKQVLRNHVLDNEEIESGLVGDSTDSKGKKSDGGIDGWYVIVNGRLIRNPTEANGLKSLKQNITLDLIILQATVEESFGLTRITRLHNTLDEILVFERSRFSEQLNDGLMNGIDTFRAAHRTLLLKGFAFNVGIYYASRGTEPASDNLLQKKARELEALVRDKVQTVTKCAFEFVDARKLVDTATKPPKSRYPLVCETTMTPKDGGLVALVKLSDFVTFLTDGGDEPLDHLFDSNVRDYQGDVEVNREIRNSLDHPGMEEFWWLNNGITILASKVDNAQGDLVIEDPLIVNGLQTSMEIHGHFARTLGANTTPPSSSKKLLVRVIKSQDAAIQDKVIKATNSQTGISPASIWATDPVQREIEIVLKGADLYYDRRKNYWRNRAIPLNQIVGISELAQAVASIFLQEPDHARARPGRYFKTKGAHAELYRKIFNKDYPIAFYPACASMKIAVDKYLRINKVDRRVRAHLLHYVLMVLAVRITGLPQPSVQKIAGIKKPQITSSVLDGSWNLVRPMFEGLGGTDKVAKGPGLVKELKRVLEIPVPETSASAKKASI